MVLCQSGHHCCGLMFVHLGYFQLQSSMLQHFSRNQLLSQQHSENVAHRSNNAFPRSSRPCMIRPSWFDREVTKLNHERWKRCTCTKTSMTSDLSTTFIPQFYYRDRSVSFYKYSLFVKNSQAVQEAWGCKPEEKMWKAENLVPKYPSLLASCLRLHVNRK